MVTMVGRIGFVVVVLLALVGISSAVGRFGLTAIYLFDPSMAPLETGDPSPGFQPPADFNPRYYEHPYLTLTHVVCGILFMVLGPLQFVAAIRNRWIGFHRWCGRVFLIASLIGVLTALAFVAVLPVFGSFSSSVAVFLASVVFLISIVQGYRHIRRFEIAEHREWMIRALAIGLGISTFRVLIPILIGLFGVSFTEAWDTVAWLGFVINISVAEAWIHVTRGSTNIRRSGLAMTKSSASANPDLRVDQNLSRGRPAKNEIKQ